MPKSEETRDVFDNLSPLDYRYWDDDIADVLSENAFTEYKLRVEVALVHVLCQRGLCDQSVVDEVERAATLVTAQDVYDEESRIRHDIRALVNCIRSQVSERAKPFVHMTATSYDIVDTANALRYRDAADLLIRMLEQELVPTLAALALRESETLQIGRTHGQHAVPITFGFAIAGYVTRLRECVSALHVLRDGLIGKFSGAVGAYNASSLFFDDPEDFENEILHNLGLGSGGHSTQIVQPEPLVRLLSEVAIAAGIMANIARDMRHLQRTEIGEVGEEFADDQVGSSTMPQKRNPIGFENVESLWKIVASRMTTVYLDQVSEHQRDLTGSASGRTYGEIFAWTIVMAKRLSKVMKKLTVDRTSLDRNLRLQGDLILAEPLYILLASLGHPDAHEKVRRLTLEAQKIGRPFGELAADDAELVPYLARMTTKQREILRDPLKYAGIAADVATTIATPWT